MNDLEYPDILVEREGFWAYQECDNLIIAGGDWDTYATIPLHGEPAYPIATIAMPAFLAGHKAGVDYGQIIAKHKMISSVRTITDVLKAGGLIPSND